MEGFGAARDFGARLGEMGVVMGACPVPGWVRLLPSGEVTPNRAMKNAGVRISPGGKTYRRLERAVIQGIVPKCARVAIVSGDRIIRAGVLMWPLIDRGEVGGVAGMMVELVGRRESFLESFTASGVGRAVEDFNELQRERIAG